MQGTKPALTWYTGLKFHHGHQAMASDKGKMKLHLKSKVTFGPNGYQYFRKAHKHLTNYMDIFSRVLIYFASKMQLFTECIHNGNLPYLFAENRISLWN